MVFEGYRQLNVKIGERRVSFLEQAVVNRVWAKILKSTAPGMKRLRDWVLSINDFRQEGMYLILNL